MFCTQCGSELTEKDRFCSQCGSLTSIGAAAQSTRSNTSTRLMRDIKNKKIAGVCAGFARYCDVDLVLMRVIWLVVAICTGVGFLAYLAAWIVMPKEPAQALTTEYVHQN
jgi:phage shock protein C